MSDEISIEDILKLPEMKDVVDELTDARYGGLMHGSRATYAKGCRGTLCKLSERKKGRRRNEVLAGRAGREYQASIHRLKDRDELLSAIISWHKRDLAIRRIEASERAS